MPYEPDFVVEADDCMYSYVVKARGVVQEPDMQEKAEAAAVWCRTATGIPAGLDESEFRIIAELIEVLR